MRWSIIRLIWLRELRDQLRDRRTLFMIVVLPLLIYPVLGFAVLQFALGFVEHKSKIGFVRGPGGSDFFPERTPAKAALSPASWLALTPFSGFWGIDGTAPAIAMAQAHRVLDYPYLIQNGHFTVSEGKARLEIVFLDADPAGNPEEKKVHLKVSAPPDFYARLEKGETREHLPALKVQWFKQDYQARLALERIQPVLEAWKDDLKKVRLARRGLPSRFDEPFDLQTPPLAPREGNLFDLLVRIFPFMLVMWSLAGALYSAVDLCAGEKERGTMETLLISPAGREEIVWGKFLTIWVFSAGTALLNLASMGLTTWQFGSYLPRGSLTVPALLWCVVLVLPLAAFFSAIALAIGAYARSTKEGQYYLMPLFLLIMPLMFLTLAPGVELDTFYSLVPVTGAALLLQRLMTVPSLQQVPWLFFLPVLLPMLLYSGLALRWAIEQFKREEVLFREADRLDLRLWLRHLFRDKEATPTCGQAIFCFSLIMALRWLTLKQGAALSPLLMTGINLLAFVAAPALFMSLILNTRPREGLCLRWPAWRDMGVAAALSLLLLPPMAALTQAVFTSNEHLTKLLEQHQPLFLEWRGGQLPSWTTNFLVFGLLAAVCEELAFRGLILSGLLRRFRPHNAVILSSFLFALFHMNVFQFVPAFLLGLVLGLLTVRSNSLAPAILFHLLHNTLLISSMYLSSAAASVDRTLPGMIESLWPAVIGLCLVLGFALLWWLYRKPNVLKNQESGVRGQESGVRG
jgi:sodium transport system permease protein